MGLWGVVTLCPLLTMTHQLPLEELKGLLMETQESSLFHSLTTSKLDEAQYASCFLYLFPVSVAVVVVINCHLVTQLLSCFTGTHQIRGAGRELSS
ncbi:hypothetical protein DPEC_G00060990 [Dallia pectoralis]|uniref:Uncharacterized protein n=1 Tax=Dallia pectoralis TaxID=75939 RepID=A0ACC2H6Y9_DALPE|nr:hypothetical protein DPEC_G00060990 [Dallia pectoralis]